MPEAKPSTDARGKKTRLGKGLGALLGEYLPPEAGSADRGYRVVRVSRIAPNPLQPRREFAEDHLRELEVSIRENGLLQPLVVRPASATAPEGAEWELVAGERRWRAVRRLGWAEVPVIVREIDDRTLLILAIVENVQRAELSPLEEAQGYRRLMTEFGFTQQDVAESVGRERSTVANLLRLLQLPAPVQRMVAQGALSMGHARAILGLGDERKMSELARRTVEEGLSVRSVEDQVRRLRSEGRRSDVRTRGARPGDSTAHVRHLETELQRHLGTAVKIKAGQGEAGRVEIPFYGSEDFERLIGLLLGGKGTGW